MISDDKLRVLMNYVQDLRKAEINVIDCKKNLIEYLQREGFGENCTSPVKTYGDNGGFKEPDESISILPKDKESHVKPSSFMGLWRTTNGYLVEVTHETREIIQGVILKDQYNKPTDKNPISWDNHGKAPLHNLVGSLQKRINENEM